MEKIQTKSVIVGRIDLKIVFLKLTQLRCTKYLKGSFVQNDLSSEQNTLRNTMQLLRSANLNCGLLYEFSQN